MQNTVVPDRILKLSKKVRKFKNRMNNKSSKGRPKENFNRRTVRYLVMNG